MTDQGTPLLADDGRASIATMLMMSHHAFRRDAALFARAVRRLADGSGDAVALHEEWKFFRGALHGHHGIEDTQMFPGLCSANPALSEPLAQLTADHRLIDPLLDKGDEAFAALPGSSEAAGAIVADLASLLVRHLAREEALIVPHLRAAHDFPAPSSDEETEMYAQGFAWSCHGIAPEVLSKVFDLLPARLTERLPAARAAFTTRCERVWGGAPQGASRTSVPDWL